MRMSHEKVFPDFPFVQASWSAIQIEPIVGSGERITALIVIKASGQSYISVPVISDPRINCLFKERANAYRRLIALIKDSIDSHLAEGFSPKQWVPIFGGVFNVDGGVGCAENLAGIYRQAVTLTSAFGQKPLDGDEKNTIDLIDGNHGNPNQRTKNHFKGEKK